jgi:hypothetical protein
MRNRLRCLKIDRQSEDEESRKRLKTFQFNDFHGEVLFAHPKDLQVAENGLLRFCMSINLDAKEIALVLPVEFALNSP